MQMRKSKPGAGKKFFITTGAGGYSRCIVGKPTDSQCNVLSNCVGYACGRFNEIIGSMKYPYLNCNAENFIERAKSAGLQVVSYPTLGGIMVWRKGNTLSGNDGAGHVAVVERIDSANQIYTSESAWGGTAFWNSVRKNTNGRWGMGSGYSFRGCIINPAIGDVHYTKPVAVDPFKGVSDEELAKRVWNGEFGNGDERKAKLGIRYNAVQALVNKGVGKPSTPTPQPKPEPTPSVDILTLVKKTIRGDFGNGEARKKALGSNYAEVQRQVNLNIQNGLTRWDNIKLF
jgi:surface antigen